MESTNALNRIIEANRGNQRQLDNEIEVSEKKASSEYLKVAASILIPLVLVGFMVALGLAGFGPGALSSLTEGARAAVHTLIIGTMLGVGLTAIAGFAKAYKGIRKISTETTKIGNNEKFEKIAHKNYEENLAQTWSLKTTQDRIKVAHDFIDAHVTTQRFGLNAEKFRDIYKQALSEEIAKYAKNTRASNGRDAAGAENERDQFNTFEQAFIKADKSINDLIQDVTQDNLSEETINDKIKIASQVNANHTRIPVPVELGHQIKELVRLKSHEFQIQAEQQKASLAGKLSEVGHEVKTLVRKGEQSKILANIASQGDLSNTIQNAGGGQVVTQMIEVAEKAQENANKVVLEATKDRIKTLRATAKLVNQNAKLKPKAEVFDTLYNQTVQIVNEQSPINLKDSQQQSQSHT